MKIYSATTAIDLPFHFIGPGGGADVLPAGTEVTAISANTAGTMFALNHTDEGGYAWAARAGVLQIELGPVIATVNEG